VERYQRQQKQEDRRAGGVIAMLYNVNRDPDKDPKGLDWFDFFPEWREAREQTEEELFEMMMLFTKQREGLSH
jgi:hypothetical protein